MIHKFSNPANFPLFQAINYKNSHIIVAGGGGPDASGVKNGFSIYDEFGDFKFTQFIEKENV